MIRTVYNKALRPHLPRKIVEYNGVDVADRRLLDLTGDEPDYEAELIGTLRTAVKPGDRVVVVGGGLGVSTTIAARLTGEQGEVTVYEASEQMYPRVADTVRRNGVGDRVVVRHGVVGKAIDVQNRNGEPSPVGDAELVAPCELPPCEVLELDCEGAERIILDELDQQPREVVVEYHECFGAPRDWVRKRLEDMDYSIVSDLMDDRKRGIGVLRARRDGV